MHARPLLLAPAAAMLGLPAAAAARFQPARQAFDLGDVRLTAGVFHAAQEANRGYLYSLDSDRLLHTFRTNAGLPSQATPLGGWERPDCEVRGHFVGHYLSACALMYASTGDEALRAKGDALVAELAKVQQALGGGYLSAYPASFFDRLEAMQNIPWAPYYVIHKIMAGLLDMHRLAGNRQALEVLKQMAAYFKGRADRLSPLQWDRTLDVEFGGMSEVLHDLYGLTGDPSHLQLARRFDKARFLGPLALEHDNLTGLHANTHLPEIAAAARRYEITGDERYRAVVRYFWDLLQTTRTYATGGSSAAEHWPEPGRLAGTLGTQNQECCTTYNILKITRYLSRWTADARYAEFYERALFNSILGTQDPRSGMLLYFVPLKPGSRKSFGTPEDSFWCCYGTGIESFSRLGEGIYYHDASSLYVDLFIPSVVRWEAMGVTVTQETRFPEEPGTTLTVSATRPTRFTLRIRIPRWAGQGARALVNGHRPRSQVVPGRYLSLTRLWRDGDRVAVHLPMSLSVEAMPDDPEVVAFLYGPLVLAGLTDQDAYLLGDARSGPDLLKPVEGRSLVFQTVGEKPKLTFIPLYQVLDEPYGVYFLVTRPGGERHARLLAAEEERRKREARVIDRVAIGDEDSERAHGFAGAETASGEHLGRRWRHCTSGGFFSYEMKVDPDRPVALMVTYWGSDVPPRTFDIVVDGQTVATQELNRNRPGEFLDVEYPVPAALTRGKERVTVRFQPHPGNMGGGVFGLAVLRAE